MARQTLESWIREACNDPEKEGPCWMLSCVHMRGTSPEEIHTTTLGGKGWAAKDLADMFMRKAESYAQDLPGAQHFCLLAFYNKSKEPEARHPFLVRGQEDFGGLGSEAPDGKGVLQQGMRHTEIALGMALRHQKEVNDQLLTAFKLIGDQNAGLLRENHDAMAIVKEIMLEKAMGDAASTMALEEYRRKTAERAKFMGLAPALLNQIFGREIFPQSTADTAIIESISESMSEEQIAQMMAILKPEQAALLAPRMTQALQKARETKELKEHNELDNEKAAE